LSVSSRFDISLASGDAATLLDFQHSHAECDQPNPIRELIHFVDKSEGAQVGAQRVFLARHGQTPANQNRIGHRVLDTSSQNRHGVLMTGQQCRMARAALNMGVRELAKLAKVATGTITRLEAGEPLKPRTVEAVQRALEKRGIEFIADGVRVRSK
jgi:DNA-binding XRE family transcriptional regulator